MIADYELNEDYNQGKMSVTCNPIKTLEECERAGKALGLREVVEMEDGKMKTLDTVTARDDEQPGLGFNAVVTGFTIVTDSRFYCRSVII